MNVILAAGLVSTAISAYNNQASIKSLQSSNTRLNDTIKQSYLPTSREHLSSLIVSDIEKYIETKKVAKVGIKYEKYQAAPEQVDGNKHIYGNPEAAYTIVEWSDLECPYCKKFHDTPKKIVDASNGLVNWQWKHMPLSFHNPAALIGAVASECVADISGNRAFWVYLDEFFSNTKGNGQGVSSVNQLAANIGVDTRKFDECMQSGRMQSVVSADLKKGQELGANGTPASFVVENGTGKSIMLSGAQPASAFVSIIQRMKKQRAGLAAN